MAAAISFTFYFRSSCSTQLVLFMPTFLTHNSSGFCMPPPSVTLAGVFSSSQRYSSLCKTTQSQASYLLLPLPGRCHHIPGGIFFVFQAAPEFKSLVPVSPCPVSAHRLRPLTRLCSLAPAPTLKLHQHPCCLLPTRAHPCLRTSFFLKLLSVHFPHHLLHVSPWAKQ